MIAPRDISGFADYTEAENVLLSKWLLTIEDTYRLYGFSRLFPRPLELRELLLSRGGIQKQVFGVSRLPDDSATALALPFDRTVPLAIWVARHAEEIVFPYKRYDVSYSFRGERAQVATTLSAAPIAQSVSASTNDNEAIRSTEAALGKGRPNWSPSEPLGGEVPRQPQCTNTARTISAPAVPVRRRRREIDLPDTTWRLQL